MTPSSITDADADSIASRLKSLWLKTLKTEILEVGAEVDAVGEISAGRSRLEPTTAIFDADGNEVGNAVAFAHLVMKKIDFTEVMRDAQNDVRSFTAGADPFQFKGEDGAPAQRLYLRWESEDGGPSVLLPISAMHISGRAAVTVNEFPLKHTKLKDEPYATGSAQIGGNPAVILISRTADGSEALSVRLT